MRATLAMVLVLPTPSLADDFGMDVRAFADRMEEQFRKIDDRTPLTLVSCADGDEKTRTVCTYKLGDYMVAMAAAAAGEDKLSEVTLICTAKTDIEGMRCVTAYGVAIAAVLPEIEREDRGKIVKALFDGVDVGDAAQVTKDGHRFILQHAMGLWFHIEANEAE